MFSENVKTTLLCGPKNLSESFMFETATYWAEKGQRVIYITPVPLEKRPGACHDRSDPTVVALKLMRFVYLPDYESLVEHLIKLQTYAAVPSVLLIDSLDDYLNDEAVRNDRSMFIAKTCALIFHSMKSCSRVLNMTVHACVWTSSVLTDNSPQKILFRNIWSLTEQEDGKVIVLEKFSHKSSAKQSYRYHVFEDGMRVLQQETCRTRIAECAMNGGNVPVCGSDGVTYSSQCQVISKQCQGVSVLIKHTGPCAETPPCLSARLTARSGTRPVCRSDGTYAPVQCHEETGYCWCVTPQGRPLPDTSVRHKRPRCSKSSPRSASTRSGGERRRSHRQYNSNRHRNTCDRAEKSKFNGNLIENFKIEFRRTNVSADDDKNVELVLSWKFNTLDKDRDGFLNKSEYTELRRLARKAVKPKKCARTFARTCDLNRDLKLSRQEWGACLVNDFTLLKGVPASLQTTATIQPFNEDFPDANSNTKEESDTNDCLSDRRSALEPLQDQNKTSRSQLYIPECTPDGRYHRIQCYSGYCWCVLQDSGKPIPGTSIKQPIPPNCNAVPTPSRPIKGCSESRKQQFLQDLVNLMQTRMTASIDTDEATKWNASPQEKVSTWLFVILDKNKNKLLEKKEWKGFRTLVSNDKQLRKCGKKLPKHCDVNNDRVISMTEWLDCLHVPYSLTDRDIEKASNLNRAVNQTKRIGPNPLDQYLNGD